MNTFAASDEGYEKVSFDMPVRRLKLTREIPALPFVPADTVVQSQRCEEILNIQAAGLASGCGIPAAGRCWAFLAGWIRPWRCW